MPTERRDTPKCSVWVADDGPHPGCAEFAPTQWITCPNDPTHIVQYEEHMGQEKDEWQQVTEISTHIMCEHHHDEFLTDAQDPAQNPDGTGFLWFWEMELPK
jgi:hypothetical protein